MGVLTDLVVADLGDAQRICDSDFPSRDFNGIEAKIIDPVKLGTLYAILTNTEFEPSFISGPPLSSGGDEGPWVMQVPDKLVQRLAKLDAKELREAAVRWAKTDEFYPEDGFWSPEAVQQLLEEFSQLCSRSIVERKSVLMWMAL